MWDLHDECVKAFEDGRTDDVVALADEFVALHHGQDQETLSMIRDVLLMKAEVLAEAPLAERIAPLQELVSRCDGVDDDAIREFAAGALLNQILMLLEAQQNVAAISAAAELTSIFTNVSGSRERLLELADWLLRVARHIEKKGDRDSADKGDRGRPLPAGTRQALVMVAAVVEKFDPFKDEQALRVIAEAEDVRGGILARGRRWRGAVQAIGRSYDKGARFWPWRPHDHDITK